MHVNNAAYSDMCPHVTGRTDYFSIDNITGDITSLVVLDRDNVTMVGEDGVFQLTVRVRELCFPTSISH